MSRLLSHNDVLRGCKSCVVVASSLRHGNNQNNDDNDSDLLLFVATKTKRLSVSPAPEVGKNRKVFRENASSDDNTHTQRLPF